MHKFRASLLFLFPLTLSYPRQNYVGDPEAYMTVPEIIERWGYPVEQHSVITEDGYVLILHRIPHGKKESSKNSSTKKPVVFLQHGLLCTSSVWVMNKPYQSAAFIFADKGFDVWMGNNRGNTYSREHLEYDTTDPLYWHFTWTEMAMYDMPAMIDGVLNYTHQPFLYYVGHSQGTLTMFTFLSERANMNKKIRKFFAIAPVATIAHVKGLFALLGRNMYQQFQLFSLVFGDTEFLPNNLFTRIVTEFICGLKSKDPVCENFIFQLSGPDSHQLNKTRIGVYLAHNPAGTSTRNMMHFAQMVKHGQHAPFDYEIPSLNIQYYGNPVPPVYNLSKISTDIYLFYSDADWLATGRDIREYLIPSIDEKYLKGIERLSDFNHNDFLWGLRAPNQIYHPIDDIITNDWRNQTAWSGSDEDGDSNEFRKNSIEKPLDQDRNK
ncbi:hypothetical protein AB6A40_005418 [Gnathostoma spinigerum]|uniref:Lipase n=1 Tax=Gnathostoma spinigerum TaxID=75299 RepID=A0ABD6EN11_9BILA